MHGIDIALDDGACRVVRWRNAFVEFRWGRLSVSSLDAMLRLYQEMAGQTTQPIFTIIVLAPDADIPTAPVRARQREVLAQIASGGRWHAAVVVEGDSVFSHLSRSILEKMQTPSFRDVAEAVRALAKEAGAPSEEMLFELVDIARA
jgi:hypothetical protein